MTAAATGVPRGMMRQTGRRYQPEAGAAGIPPVLLTPAQGHAARVGRSGTRACAKIIPAAPAEVEVVK